MRREDPWLRNTASVDLSLSSFAASSSCDRQHSRLPEAIITRGLLCINIAPHTGDGPKLLPGARWINVADMTDSHKMHPNAARSHRSPSHIIVLQPLSQLATLDLVVLSDSHQALRAIQAGNDVGTGWALLTRIVERVETLGKEGIDVRFSWSLGHEGVVGNGEANDAA
jgi:hypothetical protein